MHPQSEYIEWEALEILTELWDDRESTIADPNTWIRIEALLNVNGINTEVNHEVISRLCKPQ